MRVPLYRLRNNVEHFYTTSAEERDNAVSQYGYIEEGIACYVEDSPLPKNEYLRQQTMSQIVSHIIAVALAMTIKSAGGLDGSTDNIKEFAEKFKTNPDIMDAVKSVTAAAYACIDAMMEEQK